jgi:nucleoside-diphosphate kinase
MANKEKVHPTAERTLVMLKPDAVQRRLAGAIIERFERRGLKIVAMKMLRMDGQLAGRLYAVHRGKGFYDALVEFITSSPVIAMVIEGQGAIAMCRSMMGATFGPDAAPGTIRGDFGCSRRYNLVHGSDSAESARTEIPVLFADSEIMTYSLAAEDWVYASIDRQGR